VRDFLSAFVGFGSKPGYLLRFNLSPLHHRDRTCATLKCNRLSSGAVFNAARNLEIGSALIGRLNSGKPGWAEPGYLTHAHLSAFKK
jgi:hypothetical protein